MFCPNNVDSLPEFMSTNCPNWGGNCPSVPYAYADKMYVALCKQSGGRSNFYHCPGTHLYRGVQLRHRGESENTQVLRTVANGIQNQAIPSGVLPLSYCSTQTHSSSIYGFFPKPIGHPCTQHIVKVEKHKCCCLCQH